MRIWAIALLAGCVPQRSTEGDLAAPRSRDEWTALVQEVRAFERRIGFKETRNFLTFEQDKEGYPFCGYVSRLYLPYSYEDPAIRWTESASEEECRAFGEELDVSYGETEAVGEQESTVTASMLAAPLDRLLYLVIHEDCHDQFALPYGIEEPVCNVIAYEAMARAGMQLAQAGGGRIVDDNGTALDERALATIGAQLDAVREMLAARGIEPGSPLALRLFS